MFPFGILGLFGGACSWYVGKFVDINEESGRVPDLLEGGNLVWGAGEWPAPYGRGSGVSATRSRARGPDELLPGAGAVVGRMGE